MLELLVSVIIPTWNFARHLGDAVNGALAQTDRNFEVIVIDGGSTGRPTTPRLDYDDPLWQRNAGAGPPAMPRCGSATGLYVALLYPAPFHAI